jgi:hypothetical protein
MSRRKVFQEIREKLVRIPFLRKKNDRITQIADLLKSTSVMLWVPEEKEHS